MMVGGFKQIHEMQIHFFLSDFRINVLTMNSQRSPGWPQILDAGMTVSLMLGLLV